MPNQAANKFVKELAAGRPVRFFFSNNQRVPTTATLTNKGTANATVQFRSAPAGRNEIQRVALGGTPTGGTFRLTLNNITTGNIAWSTTGNGTTTLANLRAALDAAFGAGVVQAGLETAAAANQEFRLEFRGNLYGNRNLSLMTSTNNLTSGTAATITITELVGGAAPGAVPYANSDPDGYNAPITIVPGGIVTVSFGQGADENNANNSIGPYVEITSTQPVLAELGVLAATVNEINV